MSTMRCHLITVLFVVAFVLSLLTTTTVSTGWKPIKGVQSSRSTLVSSNRRNVNCRKSDAVSSAFWRRRNNIRDHRSSSGGDTTRRVKEASTSSSSWVHRKSQHSDLPDDDRTTMTSTTREEETYANNVFYTASWSS